MLSRFKLSLMTKEMLGDRLRRSRRAAKLTQAELGRAARISASAVSQLESGNSANLKPENLFAIARRLGKNPEWIATGIGPEHPLDDLAKAIFDLPGSSANEVLDYIEFRWHNAQNNIAQETRARYIALAEQFKRR